VNGTDERWAGKGAGSCMRTIVTRTPDRPQKISTGLVALSVLVPKTPE
jgi:hypothetical protein